VVLELNSLFGHNKCSLNNEIGKFEDKFLEGKVT